MMCFILVLEFRLPCVPKGTGLRLNYFYVGIFNYKQKVMPENVIHHTLYNRILHYSIAITFLQETLAKRMILGCSQMQKEILLARKMQVQDGKFAFLFSEMKGNMMAPKLGFLQRG